MLPNSAAGWHARQATLYLAAMCGRSTYKLTWEEIVRLYRTYFGTAAGEYAGALQRLPHNDNRYYRRTERRASAHARAMGSRSVLVVETAQRIEAGDIQRAGRDSRRKAVLPRSVQAQSLSNPGLRLLRMGRHARWQTALVLHRTRRIASAHRRGTCAVSSG